MSRVSGEKSFFPDLNRNQAGPDIAYPDANVKIIICGSATMITMMHTIRKKDMNGFFEKKFKSLKL